MDSDDAMNDPGRVVGYPGFEPASHGRLPMAGVALGKVAVHKMRAVQFVTADFAGEKYAYDPWFTALVRYRTSAVMAGLYRADEMYDLDPDDPSVCLLVMTWDQERDVEHAHAAYEAGGTEGFRKYLTDGPQLDTALAFGSENGLEDLLRTTRAFVHELDANMTIGPAVEDWTRVVVHLSDLALDLDYLPWVRSCPALEQRLPGWLTQARQTVQHPGIEPDGNPRLAVEQSVAELLALPVREPRPPHG